MKKLSRICAHSFIVVLPVLVLSSCGDDPTALDESEYAVIIAGKITLGGLAVSGYIQVERQFSSSNCFFFDWECDGRFRVSTDENGEYTAALPLDSRGGGGGGRWCGTRVLGGAFVGTTHFSLARELSAETAIGGNCSAKRHIVNFEFVE